MKDLQLEVVLPKQMFINLLFIKDEVGLFIDIAHSEGEQVEVQLNVDQLNQLKTFLNG